MKLFFTYAWLLIPLSLAPSSFAHAYLDPQSGSYAIQVAIGVIFGASYAFKNMIARGVKYVKDRFHKDK